MFIFLSLTLLLAILGAGCGDFFTSGDSIASLAISPISYLMPIGQTVTYTATGTTVNGKTQDVTSTAKWSSSNTAVATVSNVGVATAVAKGTATITATSGNGSSTASLIVSTSPLQTISISPTNPTVPQTQGTQQFTATGTFQDGSTQVLTNVVQWTSSSTSVATINSNGLATLVTGGGAQTTITASVTTTSGAITGTTNLTVN